LSTPEAIANIYVCPLSKTIGQFKDRLTNEKLTLLHNVTAFNALKNGGMFPTDIPL